MTPQSTKELCYLIISGKTCGIEKLDQTDLEEDNQPVNIGGNTPPQFPSDIAIAKQRLSLAKQTFK